MKKLIFLLLLLPSLLFLLVVGTAVGQTTSIPTINIEAPEVVAEVNGDRITRRSLAAECLQLHGEGELRELVSKTLIRLECERQGITISAEEINDEILRTAETFKLSSEEWLQILQERRNISSEQYRQDIRGQLALRKLASSRITVSDAELRDAWDAEYGPAVQARQIVLRTRGEAEAVLADVKRNPETFSAVARNRSICPVTAPYGGKLRPVRRGAFGNPDIEMMLLNLQPDSISPVVQLFDGYFAVFLCESRLDPVEVDINVVRQRLEYDIRNRKQRAAATEVFLGLQNNANIQIVFNNAALFSQYPDVAALVNGQVIPQQALAEACIQKHGKEVLSDMMSRLLVAQACKRAGIVIGEADIDKEIHEMAFKHLPLKPDGSADIDQWYRRAMEESGLSLHMYRKNVVVPVLSLKRLTREATVVTEQDVQRAFEANFGRKVRCLAIYFRASDQRRAQEVWQKANQHKTEENFGDLAEHFSFDPHSRLGRGVIPPIARHCGLPEMEKAAFLLQPGELSEIIQIDDHLVILFCIGHDEPQSVKIEEVQADLVADIFEKKQQMIVARYFERLHEQAVLINHLTGETQNPALEATQEGQSLQR